MSFEYIRNYYGVPAEIRRRVRVYGEEGIIIADLGNYIGVNLDKEKPGKVRNYHPTDGVEYLEMGKIRKPTRSQKSYQEYLNSEANESFAEWMGFKCRYGIY